MSLSPVGAVGYWPTSQPPFSSINIPEHLMCVLASQKWQRYRLHILKCASYFKRLGEGGIPSLKKLQSPD